jgi:hypothetical protein
MIWKLEACSHQNPSTQFGLRLAECDLQNEALVLGLVVMKLGRRATITFNGDSTYYNYTITLAEGTTYQWLHDLLWSLLLRKLGIRVYLR